MSDAFASDPHLDQTPFSYLLGGIATVDFFRVACLHSLIPADYEIVMCDGSAIDVDKYREFSALMGDRVPDLRDGINGVLYTDLYIRIK